MMDVERLADDVADRHARIQARIRILEDHLDLVLGEFAGGELLAIEINFAFRRLIEADDCAARRGLAAAGLADEAERLSFMKRKAHAVDGLEDGRRTAEETARRDEMFFEVLDLEQFFCHQFSASFFCCSQHFAACVSPPAIAVSSGGCMAQICMACGQRSTNGQPLMS